MIKNKWFFRELFYEFVDGISVYGVGKIGLIVKVKFWFWCGFWVLVILICVGMVIF